MIEELASSHLSQNSCDEENRKQITHEGSGERRPSYTASESVNCYGNRKSVWRFFQQMVPYHLSILLLGVGLKQPKSVHHRDFHT